MHLVIGNPTWDIQPDQERILGGTITYTLRALESLGVRACGLAKAGREALSELQRTVIAPVHCIESNRTAHFENRYSSCGDREQCLMHEGDAIDVTDVTALHRMARSVHFAPVYKDFSPNLTTLFTATKIKLITLQGWLRRVAYDKRVLPMCDLLEIGMILKTMDWVIVSEEDIEGVISPLQLVHFTKRLVVTRGRNGATLYTAQYTCHVPVTRICSVDPTGAGDVFVAGLTHALLSGKDGAEALVGANEAAGNFLMQKAALTPLEVSQPNQYQLVQYGH